MTLRSETRFLADATDNGDAIVLDAADYSNRGRFRVVIACRSDEQAERIAAFLNGELGWNPAS